MFVNVYKSFWSQKNDQFSGKKTKMTLMAFKNFVNRSSPEGKKGQDEKSRFSSKKTEKSRFSSKKNEKSRFSSKKIIFVSIFIQKNYFHVI
jgi:hypothetical protein